MSNDVPRSFFVHPDIIRSAPVEIFEGLFPAIEIALNEPEAIQRSKALLKALLEPQTIKKFIPFYFNSIKPDNLDNFFWQTTLPPYPPEEGVSENTFSESFNTAKSYRRAESPNSPKTMGDLPLSRQEYEQAYEFLKGKSHYPAAFHIMSDLMIAYGYALDKVFKPAYSQRALGKFIIITNTISGITDALKANSFKEESLPVAAYEMARAETELKGLSASMNRHASRRTDVMHSEGEIVYPSGKKGRTETVCPFRQAYGHFMNTNLGYNDKGLAELREGLEQFGLLKFTIGFLAKHGVVELPCPNPLGIKVHP